MSAAAAERLPKQGNADWLLFVVTLALLSFGIVMVFDASYPHAIEIHNDKWYWVKKQILWAAIGLAGMFVASRIPYPLWKRWKVPLIALGAAVLMLIVVHFIGHGALGARRWISLGPVKIQPSEFTKLAVVLFLAATFANKRERALDLWKGVVPTLILCLIPVALIEREPDMGTAISLLLTVFVVLFAAGVKTRWLAAFMAIFIALGAVAILHKGTDGNYRWNRLTTFINPDADPLNAGFQIRRSTSALGTGGLTGLGFGESREKRLGNLPMQRTDFIYAIVGEEFGLAGTCGLLVGFLLLSARGYHIATQTKDPFGALLATGITAMVTVQTLLNIAVVTASAPTTGIPLPFISYGGSSLVPTLFAMGILLNISRREPRAPNRVRADYGGSATIAKERLLRA
jgi:cell division protein FtsW